MLATRIPAMAGPTTRDALNIEEFRAMAFIRSLRPTISTMKDWRAGISNAFTTPSSAASTKMCQIRTAPLSTNAASTKASSIAEVCVAITTRRRLYRSATIPATGENTNEGICEQNPIAPSRTELPVRRYTSHASAMFCIHVPISDISCPPKNS